jgi:hypothetical protein
MSKTLWRKKIIGGTMCLTPDCVDAAEWLKKTKLEACVMIEPRRPRNAGHHKKLFALLRLARDNWPVETTTNALLGLIKLKTGHCDPIHGKDGIVYIPRSINFESMDETEFCPFYDSAIQLISVALGVSVEDLEQNQGRE